ncbi:MAG: hypothetical protein ACXABY_32895 [Candidatus Thorarchaeota archaeon]|jgi:hypothetical protein
MTDQKRFGFSLIIGLLLAMLFVRTSLAYGFDSDDYYAETERTYQRADGFYLIHFSYNTQYADVPLTDPPGAPHYGADITIYKIVDGKKVKQCPMFNGVYVPGGCFEDDSNYLINKCLKKMGD